MLWIKSLGGSIKGNNFNSIVAKTWLFLPANGKLTRKPRARKSNRRKTSMFFAVKWRDRGREMGVFTPETQPRPRPRQPNPVQPKWKLRHHVANPISTTTTSPFTIFGWTKAITPPVYIFFFYRSTDLIFITQAWLCKNAILFSNVYKSHSVMTLWSSKDKLLQFFWVFWCVQEELWQSSLALGLGGDSGVRPGSLAAWFGVGGAGMVHVGQCRCVPTSMLGGMPEKEAVRLTGVFNYYFFSWIWCDRVLPAYRVLMCSGVLNW
jgi:hypothetical protein